MGDLPHLRLTGTETSYDYTARGGGGGEFQRPVRDAAQHGQALKNELTAATLAAESKGFTSADPILITYELQPHAIDKVESLELQRSGIELLSVVRNDQKILATVRVPSGKRRIIEAVLDRYATKLHPRSNRPAGEDLVANIDHLRLATERDLWTDAVPFPANELPIWWEIWLHHEDSRSPEATHEQFLAIAADAGLVVKKRRVVFPDRVVVLGYGSFSQWQAAPRLLLMVAELRKAKELATDYVDIEPRFQADLVTHFQSRIIPPERAVPSVCLLDTGVERSHPLIEPALSQEDTQTVDPDWGIDDHDAHRHGTTMAGIALYGPLTEAFISSGPFRLRHRLESVKILPRNGENDPDLYGEITAEAIARAESVSPARKRVVCLTVTADSRDGGRPSAWSARIDQVAAGGDVVGEPKLICVAAGNLRDQIYSSDYRYPVLEGGDCSVEDPGQAWNALTVGAMTDLVIIEHPDFDGYEPIAVAGDLSPTSRTSLAWPEPWRQGWPVKPDIVMEGGNWAVNQDGVRDTPDDLGLLTTTLLPTGRLLTVTRDTSPATAAAARLSAQIWTRYPNLWPETVRALMVHSAKWTNAMNARFPGRGKASIQKKLRCYGYGVPDLDRAIYSAENAATLIFEGALQPYKFEDSEVKTNQMHLHALPWPVTALEALGSETVRMHVTLSYFIEPSPGRRGWTRRHRYASHGLRFDVKRPTETRPQFLRRITEAMAGEESEEFEASTEDQPWVVGKRGRGQGSIHSDWWEGSAVALASCGEVAVFPVTGWWRERRQKNRFESKARYSLVVTIETQATDVELYTEIAAQATVQTEIAV